MTDSRVLVIGAGYVGLISAVGLAKLGHHVELVETRGDRREMLAAGRVPIFEPGVEDILGPAILDGRIIVGAAPGPGHHRVILVCVGTPIAEDGSSDTSQLVAAVEGVRGQLDGGAALVIRSTTAVGGTRRLIEELDLPAEQVFLNPEFLRQGTALADFLAPTRLVLGWAGSGDASLVAEVESLTAAIAAPRLRVTYEEAEIIKNAANAFLALKLSFANEIAVLSEHYGADVDRVLEGIGHDPRIGTSYLRPSFGFGGSCLPKELQTITLAGWERGVTMHVTAAASAANRGTQMHFARQILDAVGPGPGKVVAMLGLAFKAGTDDVRESPAIRVAGMLVDAGVAVRGYDPEASANCRTVAPWIETVATIDDAARGVNAIVIGTEWPEFRKADWSRIRTLVADPVVIDGRRLLDAEQMRALGYLYRRVGSTQLPPDVAEPCPADA
jgi:UDPglucose 6-dehydrogenase